jgi:hypothetical protein
VFQNDTNPCETDEDCSVFSTEEEEDDGRLVEAEDAGDEDDGGW